VTAPGPLRLLEAPVHRLGSVASTQEEAAKLAAAGAPEGTVVTAVHQHRGRGIAGATQHG